MRDHTPTRIRLAAETDAAQILTIYSPVVADTSVSFEESPPSAAETARRIGTTLQRYPWLVDDAGGRIAGYAYATEFRRRRAYQWAVEVSAYTHPDARRRGLARALYTSLFAILRSQGFMNAFAGIALPNDASVGLHESMGFRPVGVLRGVGFKLEAWHDVGWWQMRLQEPGNPPDPPTPLSELRESDVLTRGLAAGEALLSR